jgi:hypothetical protein
VSPSSPFVSAVVAVCDGVDVTVDVTVAFVVCSLHAVSLFPRGGVPSAVESFLTISGGDAGVRFHYTTFESAVHGVGR